VQPNSRSRWTNAATQRLQDVGVPAPKSPTVGSLADCCADAASGHDATALPNSDIKSRRLIASPRGQDRGIVAAQMRVGKGCPMSALGHKQTCAMQTGMSAFPPIATAKADSRSSQCLRFTPKADIYQRDCDFHQASEPDIRRWTQN